MRRVTLGNAAALEAAEPLACEKPSAALGGREVSSIWTACSIQTSGSICITPRHRHFTGNEGIETASTFRAWRGVVELPDCDRSEELAIFAEG